MNAVNVMENVLRSVLLWMFVASSTGHIIAQTEGNETGSTTVFKWNATDALVGRWALGFEHSVGANLALGLELDFIHVCLRIESLPCDANSWDDSLAQ